jgi:hypothetical protein
MGSVITELTAWSSLDEAVEAHQLQPCDRQGRCVGDHIVCFTDGTGRPRVVRLGPQSTPAPTWQKRPRKSRAKRSVHKDDDE